MSFNFSVSSFVFESDFPASTPSDSEKAEAAGWGAEEGKQELEAETLAEGDAKEEQQTATGTATPVREAPIEEEDNTQTYEQYLAAQADKKLNIAALPEARKANEGVDESQLKGTVVAKKSEDEEWFMGAPVRSTSLSPTSVEFVEREKLTSILQIFAFEGFV